MNKDVSDLTLSTKKLKWTNKYFREDDCNVDKYEMILHAILLLEMLSLMMQKFAER